jgi:hypothetical protein
MKKPIGIVFAFATVITVVVSASASSPAESKREPVLAAQTTFNTTIGCVGKVCGGPGGTLNCSNPPGGSGGRYVYQVIPKDMTTYVDTVEIGTDIFDNPPFFNLYANRCMPSGWNLVAINAIPRTHDIPFTQHGTVTSNFSQCQYLMVWTGPQQNMPFELGFQIPNAQPHDVNWKSLLMNNLTGLTAWGFKVGLGKGPVHGPFPQPPPPPPPPPPPE